MMLYQHGGDKFFVLKFAESGNRLLYFIAAAVPLFPFRICKMHLLLNIKLFADAEGFIGFILKRLWPVQAIV